MNVGTPHCRLDADALAGAAGWAAAAIPARPAVPVLGGMLIRVEGGRLSLCGTAHAVSGRADLDVAAGIERRRSDAPDHAGARTRGEPGEPRLGAVSLARVAARDRCELE